MAKGWHCIPILCLLLVSFSGARTTPGDKSIAPQPPATASPAATVSKHQGGATQITVDSDLKTVRKGVKNQVQNEAKELKKWEPFIFTRLTTLSNIQLIAPLATSTGQLGSQNNLFQAFFFGR